MVGSLCPAQARTRVSQPPSDLADPQTCIYDEGHRLKNCLTKAYIDLLSIKPKWRLLLTGTPLQNNLQELVVSLSCKSADASPS